MLKAPSIISKVQTLADNTIRMQVDLQELAPDNEAEIFRLRNKLGWFVFAESGDIRETDIPTEPLEDNQKTPSQRLRGVMYVYWEKSKKDTDFETFYRQQTEKYIELIKRKIDEIS